MSVIPNIKALELKIKALQTAPRDAEMLERLFKAKGRERDEAMHREGIHRLIPEIEMVKVVYCIWCCARDHDIIRQR